MKKELSLVLGLVLLLQVFTCIACAESAERSGSDSETAEYKYQRYAAMTPEEIVTVLTLDQKAAQMVQPILYKASETGMRDNCYGSIYGDEGMREAAEWCKIADEYQYAAISSESGIPFLLAQDDAHGVGYCIDAVYYPHNIGLGAANDEELTFHLQEHPQAISLLPFTAACTGVTINNVRWPLTNATLTQTFPNAVSNELLPDQSKLTVNIKEGILGIYCHWQ